MGKTKMRKSAVRPELPRAIALLLAVGVVLAVSVHGSTLTVTPGADTSLLAAFPDKNLGANTNILVGANGSGLSGRGLIRFNLAGQIPSGATVQSSTLSFNVVIVPGGGGVASVFDLRRVLVDWCEGLGTGNAGSPANAGESTWNNRFHPATPWTVPGGAVGSDFSATISATVLVTNLGNYAFIFNPNLVADVQQWLLNPAANFGWALVSEAESTPFTARRIGSREDTNSSPVLTIEYTMPSPPTLFGLALIGNQLRFSFNLESNRSCAVEFRGDLNGTNWNVLSNIPALPANTTIHITNMVAGLERYFRVRPP